MRILFVNAHGDPAVGGAEKHVAELAGELFQRGYAVDLLQAFPDEGPPGFPGTRTVLHATHWKASEVRRLRNHVEDVVVPVRNSVRTAIDSLAPDLVHTHNLPGFGTGVWETCRTLGIPVVHTLHDYYLLCPRVTLTSRDGRGCRPGLYCGLRSRRLARFGSAVGDVIGVSRYVLERHAQVFATARRHVIRNPATTTFVASRPPRDELRTIGFIGSLEHNKGLHVLLGAAPKLQQLGCELVVAGSGRLEGDVRAAVERGGVRYVGRVGGPEKSAFFDTCDLGVVPSIWDEPAPYTPLEWLSSARPVLVSARGGIGEMLEHWGGAIAIEPTTDGIVAAVEQLREPGAWQRAVSRVECPGSPHAFAEWVDEHEAVYERSFSAVAPAAMRAEA